MYDTIARTLPADPDYPARTHCLELLRRVLDGTLYEGLPYSFQDEKGADGTYIPIRNRRPSVRYPLSRIVVADSVSLLFGDGHFPTLDCADHAVRRLLNDIAVECGLNGAMQEAALRGSVGSVALLLRVLRGRVFVGVLDTPYLTPVWDPEAPDTLISVTERYKVRGAQLLAQGYEDIEPAAVYWFMRRWDAQREVWFQPAPVAGGGVAAEDAARTVRHGLGFVPIVWIRNLPGGDEIDGACTFRPAIETQIEIEYQLSQAGRGLKYSSDPLLLIREPAGDESTMLRGGGNALVVSEKGDAKMLEIGGTASEAVVEYVRTLREFALEAVHGNRASPERMSAAQSGRALELMNQGLVWLADSLRVSYGDGLLRLVRMIVRASNVYVLRVTGAEIAPIDAGARIGLVWPCWYPPSATDRQADAVTLKTLGEAGDISRETAVRSIAETYGIDDVGAEIARIDAERQGTLVELGHGNEADAPS
jgi:hypothetical protein